MVVNPGFSKSLNVKPQSGKGSKMRSIKKFSVVAERVVMENPPLDLGVSVTTPRQAALAAQNLIGSEEQEVFIVLMFDARNKLLGFVEAARGGIDSCHVDTRVVFRAAILQGASGIIVSHNHPSGDTSPSAEDDHMTARLRHAGKLLDVHVLDHVIVSHPGSKYYSYSENDHVAAAKRDIERMLGVTIAER